MRSRCWHTVRCECGTAAIIVAIVAVVLMAVGALVVDAGALYAEARTLQNAADAAALAIAEDCAEGDCGAHLTTAQTLADANSDDGATAVDDVTIDMDAKTVTVATSTLRDDGTNQVPFGFARVLGFEGMTVHRSATASWAAPISDSSLVLPLTISGCEYDWASTQSESVIFTFHTDTQSQNVNCPVDGSGSDGPGGFGWITPEGVECSPDLDGVDEDGTWAPGENGVPPPDACDPDDFPLGTILVAVYENVRGEGEHFEYEIVGYAAIELTGYRLRPNGGSGGEWDNGDPPCENGDPRPLYLGGGTFTGNDTVCIGGRFVEYVELSAPSDDGVDDFGVVTIRLIS